MATQTAKIAATDNGVPELLASLMQNSSGLFGTGTSTSKTELDPAALAQSQQLLTQVLAGNDPATMDAMVQNILDQAKTKFGPQISDSIATGARPTKDTTLAINQNKAEGYATAAAAEAKLNAITKNNAVAGSIVNSRLESGKTVTTETGASPFGKVLSAAGLAGTAYSAYGKATKKKAEDLVSKIPNGQSLPFGESADLATQGSTSGAVPFGENANLAQAPALDANALIDLGDTTAVSAFADTASSALPFGESASLAGEGAAVGEAGADIFGGASIGEGIGDAVGAGVVDAGIGTAVEGAGIEELIPLAAAAWVVCTELNKQGRMKTRFYVYGSRVFANYPELGKRGYYIWAIPSVKHLRKHPNSLYSKFLEKIFNWRIEYLAAKQGAKGARKLVKGQIISVLLYAFCWTISFFCPKPDWKSLYLEAK